MSRRTRLVPRRQLHLQRLEDRTVPATWTGGGGSPNWSDGGNWAGNILPVAGDDLTFPAGVLQTTSVNNLGAGTVYHSITFSGGNYSLSGNAIGLSGGITDSTPAIGNLISFDINLTASETIDVNAIGGTLTLNGAIGQTGGSFGLTKTGVGTLTIGGAAANSYNGTTAVDQGVLNFNKTPGVNAVIATLVVGDSVDTASARLLASDQIDNNSNVVVLAGGTFDLNGFNEELHDLQLRTNTSAAGAVTTGAGTLTLDSAITVIAEGTGAVGATITGKLSLGGATRIVNVDDGSAAVDLNINATISGLASEGITKVGPGTLRLSGNQSNTYTGATTVAAGTLELDKIGTGGIAVAVVGDLVILGGAATEVVNNQIADTATVTVNSGGTFHLGGFSDTFGTLQSIGGFVDVSTGHLNTQSTSLDASSTVAFGLTTTSPNSPLVTTSGLTVGGTLQLTLTGSLAVGTNITLFRNGGGSATSGQFTNAAEGSFVNVGGTTFQITYHGGMSGNDVVLTVVPTVNGQISGEVFVDANGDGMSTGDAGADGVTVQLDAGADGTVDQTTTTAGGGLYSFGSLVPGSYRVRIVLPGGAVQTTTNPADINLTNGQDVANVNFGVFSLVSVSGLKFNDRNGDGIQNNGEPGVGGVTITLTNLTFGGTPLMTTTNANGTFTITNVGPGSYQVAEVLPAGTHQTTTNPAEFATSSGTNVSGITFGNQANRVPLLATGAGFGGGPHVKVYNADGSLRFSFLAYDAAFTGGVRVATADVTGDGIDDIITAAGTRGGPHVKVFDGSNLNLVDSFLAYSANFTGGVYVAGGDVNNDGFADIITGAGPGGGPHVEVFSGTNLSILKSFYPYATTFAGGVRVGSGDVNGDHFADIITGAGPGGGPHVEAFSGTNLALLQSVIAFDGNFAGGVYVAGGDINHDGKADLVVGAGETGGPQVKVFGALTNTVLANFFVGNSASRNGIRVGAEDLNGDGNADIITGAGPNTSSQVNVFSGANFTPLQSFTAYDPAFLGGIYVG